MQEVHVLKRFSSLQNAQVNAFVAGLGDTKKMSILHALYGKETLVSLLRSLTSLQRDWRIMLTFRRYPVRKREALVVSLLHPSRPSGDDHHYFNACLQVKDAKW